MIRALRRPWLTLALAGCVVLAALVAATQLSPTPSSDLLVRSGSPVGQATSSLERQFGQDPIIVSIDGDLQSQTLQPKNLVALVGFEGRLASLKGVHAVYGPGTFLNQAIVQTGRMVTDELGAVSKQLQGVTDPKQQAKILGPKIQEYKDLMIRLGGVGQPSLSNTNFVLQVVYGASVHPKQRFAWLFPDDHHALVLVRPDPGLRGDRALALGKQIRAAAASSGMHGVRLQVAGLPLLGAALEHQTRSELFTLAPVALIAMLLLLLAALRMRRGWFIPLLLALAATLVSIGLAEPLGIGLTTATVAGLPVVLGLALDFAVQVQARYWSQRAAGEAPAVAARAARRAVGPTLLLAGGAMCAGFLVLVTRGVPLLDRLAAVLIVGTVSGLAFALLVGPALLTVLDRGTVRPLALTLPGWVRGVPLRAVVCVAAFAAVGVTFSHQTHLDTDLSALAPHGLGELRHVQDLQRSLGTSGEVSIAVHARDVTDPAVLGYMNRVIADVTKTDPRLRPGPSIADLVTGGANRTPSRAEVNGVMRLIPAYYTDAVVSHDRHTAALSFGVPFASVAQQARMVETIERALRDAPRGVSANTGGLVAAAAHSSSALEGSRPSLLLLAVAAIAVVLLAVWRRPLRVVLVLAPALVAAGLAALGLELTSLSLSPLGAALEPLVLAVGLEFGMLLELGYREARERGEDPAAAAADALRRIGAAVAVSAGTVAVGFATLLASGLPLLRQLGWLVAAELGLCLVVALLVVPSVAARLDGVTLRRRRAVPA